MGGWEEEVFYSLYRAAMIKAILNYSWPEIQQAFLDSYDSRPSRAEPLYQIARLYRQVHNKPKLAYIFARMALEIPYPADDILFIHDDVYKFQILDEIGASAFYAGKPHVGYHACQRLVNEGLVSDAQKERVMENLKSYEKVTQQIHAQEAQFKINEQMQEMEKKRQNKLEKKNTPKKSTKANQTNNAKKRRSKSKR
jgi:hypothetical protein